MSPTFLGFGHRSDLNIEFQPYLSNCAKLAIKLIQNISNTKMKTIAATLLAAICTTSNALTLQDSDSDAQYGKCTFYDARDYSGPGSPRIDATLAFKIMAGSTGVEVDFGFDGGDENTQYTLDFWSLEHYHADFNIRKCTRLNSKYQITKDLIKDSTDDRGDFVRHSASTDAFDLENVEDRQIVAMLYDDYDTVACCLLRKEHSKYSYVDAIEDLDSI